MAVFSGSRVVTDGLVFDVDAGNPKSVGLSTVEVLVVGGGGAAGSDVAGGGGGGAVVYNSSFSVTSGVSYSVTVGAGGTTSGAAGSSSAFSTITAAGGAGGANWTVSSGGASGNGNAGGTTLGYIGASYSAGGGGGAGGSGGSAYTVGGVAFGGNGGPGVYYSVSGARTGYGGGGGGGGGSDTANIGGPGTATEGGGNGSARWLLLSGYNGTANTGGGGGGTGRFNGVGQGGSGVVIIRYPGLQKASGGTVTNVGGYTVHTFTSVGTTTFLPDGALPDLSGSSLAGTLTNCSYNSSNGGSIAFNGSSSLATFSGAGAVNLSATMTASVWVYYVSGNGRIFQKDGPPHTRLWEIGGYAGTFRMEMWHSNGTGTIGTGNALAVNGWTHLTLTFDGTNILMYQNGILVTTVNFPGDIRTDITTPLYLGGYWSGEYLNGRISKAMLYNRALSADEVAQNFQAQRGRFGI